MKQVFGKKGKIIVEDVPAPVCEDDGIVVANSYSLISIGTEREALRKRESMLKLALQRPDLVKKVWNYFKKQGAQKTRELVKSKMLDLIPLGYCSAGTVVEVGRNVIEFKVGDRVACGGAGYATHSEFVYVPKNLAVKILDNVSFEEAVFTTLGAIALQGVRRGDVKVGESVAVIGLGLIGLLTVQILKAAGCNVIGVDVNEKKVKLAEKMGLDKGVTANQNLVKEVEKFTDCMGVDAAIITASSTTNQPLFQALEICRKKGRIVVVGDFPLQIPRDPFYKKELDLLISTSYGPGRYDKSYEEKGIDYPAAYVRWTENRNMKAFLDFLAKKTINVKPLISYVFDVKDAAKAYEKVFGGNSIGILFRYKPEIRKIERKFELVSKPRKKGKINVALIGAGNFAKAYHLPNLKSIENYNIYAIVDNKSENAKKVAEQYGARYFATDYKNVLKDKNVDLIIITTRHNSHAQITIDAAKAKKDVLVEKPMAMNEKELEKVVKQILKSKVNFAVGFNRRFSPFSVKAKELLDEKEGPIIINYNVNAGPLPSDHWIYDSKEGGGRIVGECCHFFDLFNYFIGSEPVEITTKSISSEQKNIRDEDNVIINIKYKDGSLANLIYNSISSEKVPKERIEIMKDGSTIIIDDFKRIDLFGFRERSFSSRQDKGHFNELVEFAKTIKGVPSQKITLEDCVNATKISFDVTKKIRG